MWKPNVGDEKVVLWHYRESCNKGNIVEQLKQQKPVHTTDENFFRAMKLICHTIFFHTVPARCNLQACMKIPHSFDTANQKRSSVRPCFLHNAYFRTLTLLSVITIKIKVSTKGRWCITKSQLSPSQRFNYITFISINYTRSTCVRY